MTCFHPLSAFRSSDGSIVFNKNRSDLVESLNLPCGQCVGCRLERSRQWAIRCVHEASMFENNCFITLTYDNDHLPPFGSLRLSDFQKFMKRLRSRFSGIEPVIVDDELKYPIRFYHCGEYGESLGRPHYHACLFNFDFSDKYFWRTSESGARCYRSPSLEELWPFGQCEIGDVTFESAAYVARYIMKKINGDAAADHYVRYDSSTGEISSLMPEYTTMSRKPGIGSLFFDKYYDDMYPLDRVIVRGLSMRPPRFYDLKVKEIDPGLIEALKFDRFVKASAFSDDNSIERLNVREKVQKYALQRLNRDLQ